MTTIYEYRIIVPDEAENMGPTVFNAMQRLAETWKPYGVTIERGKGEGRQVVASFDLPVPAVEQDNTNP